jgi:hypothetical protein
MTARDLVVVGQVNVLKTDGTVRIKGPNARRLRPPGLRHSSASTSG